MKKYLVVMLAGLLIVFTGCSGDVETPEAPAQGVVFAIEDTGSLTFDEYEIQLRTPDEQGFIVITLLKDEGYKVTWDQSLVEEEQGNSYKMTAYKAELEGNMVPDLDKPLSETRELTFTDDSTNEGRLVLVKVSR